ncbi:conserved hypothetical protein [Talaromyces marneffei ATCC 18224]|uniref:Uncharacterized protein n=1 Tax=Talaromyces marneffei (strain ATCC 18224 / CBS 334.59 / QM 7333) TaxID=441960 RepID=B6QQ60_TALMQ|nr:conserved hypothetical protein [Talaromyces marneffei ATCC 18224]
MHLMARKLVPHRLKPTNLVGSDNTTWTGQENQPQPYPKKTPISPEVHTTRGKMKPVSPNQEIMKCLPPGGPGGSLSWVSDKTRERDSFRRIRLNIGHTAPNSPLVPVDMNGWLTHRVEVVEDNIERMNRAIELRRMEKVSFFKANIQTALDGRRFGDFRSTVLAQTTIWRPDEVSNPSRPQAPWPDSGERKHEGYQRVRSGYSRFPPLPRVPGNPTVNWKQRSPIAAYELDKVGLPVILQEATTENDPNTESMIGESLLREIDA